MHGARTQRGQLRERWGGVDWRRAGERVIVRCGRTSFNKRKHTWVVRCDRTSFKGELRPEISLLHMKVLTLIKAKSNVFFDTCNAVAAREDRKPKY